MVAPHCIVALVELKSSSVRGMNHQMSLRLAPFTLGFKMVARDETMLHLAQGRATRRQ